MEFFFVITAVFFTYNFFGSLTILFLRFSKSNLTCFILNSLSLLGIIISNFLFFGFIANVEVGLGIGDYWQNQTQNQLANITRPFFIVLKELEKANVLNLLIFSLFGIIIISPLVYLFFSFQNWQKSKVKL